jgi:Mn2+/Fe2+ NRAMP family transporter
MRRRLTARPWRPAPGRARIALVFAALGPGVLAGLSDDDPAGITTYSIAGAEHGYALLWVLVVATGMLILYHQVCIRVGAVTGRGLTALIRERKGGRAAAGATGLLVVANLGTTCAEFAGVAAALGLAGVPRAVSVPLAGAVITWFVIGSRFRRVEHVLLVLSATLAAYVLAGLMAHPDWGAAARGSLVPGGIGSSRDVLVVTAAVGTTIAPWGIAFIQSYAVDKRVRPSDLALERLDVIGGAVMTGVVGAFVILACAATLYVHGRSIESARDAALALEPLAGAWSSRLFGAGLLGAGLLALAIVPLSTAYSVAEAFGREARLDDGFSQARVFYGTYVAVMAAGAAVVLVPQVPLVPILFLSQAANAVLLVPLLVFVNGLAADEGVMGAYRIGRVTRFLAWLTVAALALCVAALAAGGLA